PPAAVARDRMAQRLDETVLLRETLKTRRKRPITSKISATRARDAAPNMFDWRDPPGKSEWPNGDWEAAQGGHPRQEGGEGTAQETHAAEASAVHHCRLGARTRPGSGGGAPNRQRPHEQS